MGESRKEALKLGFDGSVRLEFRGATVSSDTGLLAYRDVDDVFALTATASAALKYCRTGTNIRHSLTALLRQSIYSRLAGHDDLNDADRLAVDPVMRQLVGGRATEKEAAYTSQISRFETAALPQADNLALLTNLPGQWIEQVQQRRPTDRVILDLDSSVSETHGQQEGSAYNGYFECTCYHPLFCFNQDGDLERALLRNGNVTSADDWQSAVDLAVSRFGKLDILVNNAGIFDNATVENTTVEAWDRVLDINAKGVFLGSKSAIGGQRCRHPPQPPRPDCPSRRLQ